MRHTNNLVRVWYTREQKKNPIENTCGRADEKPKILKDKGVISEENRRYLREGGKGG